jgi:hypothetical protein
MAPLERIAPHLRAILAPHISLQLVNWRRLEPADDVQRNGLIGVAAETMDLKIAITNEKITMNSELEELLSSPTADVPDVGRICFGMCRGASYEAAKSGEIPTIRVGRLLKVPTADRAP